MSPAQARHSKSAQMRERCYYRQPRVQIGCTSLQRCHHPTNDPLKEGWGPFLRPKLITGCEYSPDGVLKADSVICLRDPGQAITHSPHNLEDPRRTLETKTKHTKPKNHIVAIFISRFVYLPPHEMWLPLVVCCFGCLLCFVEMRVFISVLFFSSWQKIAERKPKDPTPPSKPLRRHL